FSSSSILWLASAEDNLSNSKRLCLSEASSASFSSGQGSRSNNSLAGLARRKISGIPGQSAGASAYLCHKVCQASLSRNPIFSATTSSPSPGSISYSTLQRAQNAAHLSL